MNTQTPLRFAVLLESVELTEWQAESVARLIASGTARLDLIIKACCSAERPMRRIRSALRHLLWQAYFFILARRASVLGADRKLFRDTEVFACEANRRGGALELGEREAEEVRRRDLDFVLYFGGNVPGGELATVAAQGVWWFRFGEGRETSGPLAAFRAASLRRDNVVRVQLVRSSGSPQVNLQVLRVGYFAVPYYSVKRTLAGIFQGSVDFPVLACRDLMAGRELKQTEGGEVTSDRVIQMPSNAAMLKFLLSKCAHNLVSLFQVLLTRVQWNVGFFDSASLDPFTIITARDVRWLQTNGTKHFAADPFLLGSDGGVTLLVEQLDPANNCGRIAAYQFDHGHAVPLGTVIEEPVHLSYPCLVRSRGEVYCVPEQAESKCIVIYRAIEFPLRWERLGPLLSGVVAVDSTLFEHGGYWWLAYTDASIDRNGRLMLWYADELTGPWQPHALNPVKIDPRCSRGAGSPFVYRGALVRPSQDCSVRYGAKIIFNRVIALTPDQFSEETIGELRPDPAGPYWYGLHTISYDGSVAIVDGSRSLFDPTALAAKVRGRLRRHSWRSLEAAADHHYRPADSWVRSASVKSHNSLVK